MIKDKNGKFKAIIVIIRDITERKKAQEKIRLSALYARSLIEASLDPLVTINPDGKITDVNKATEKITGILREDLIGTDFCNYFTEPEKAKEGYKQVLLNGFVMDYPLVICHKSGGVTDVIYNATLYKNEAGEVQGIFAAARDITEHKKAQDALKDYTRQIEQINNELNDFTYIVSHDLKEPLRCIDAFSKFIEDDYKDKLDEEGKNYLERIRTNAVRMQSLIENLLEISRIDRTKKTLEEVQIEELINEVNIRLEYAIKAKNVQLVIQNKLPKVFCDRVRLTEVFVNLISNAIKFNDKPNPRIEIGYNQKDTFHEFSIKDNGIGIEEQYFDKIFEIFQRLGKREEYEGIGAGLTIAKKIVQMHKGKIRVESKIGEGTTFYFTIPQEKSVILGKKKIGEILIEKKLITDPELKEALREQEGL